MYKLTSNTGIIRVDDGAYIPADPGNTDYQTYLTWLDAGNTPEPTDQLPAVIITSVTMRQARLALLSAGLLDDVDTAIAGIADANERKAAEIEWEYAQEVRRDHQWVQNLAGELSLTEAALDALFAQAAAL